MIDAHAHLESIEPLPDAWRSAGVHGVVGAGVHPEHFDDQCRVARRVRAAGILAGVTVGLHPWAVGPSAAATSQAVSRLRAVLADPPPELVGIGELGLDHARARTALSRAQQAHAFRAQLEVALQTDLPVVLHVVKAHAEVLALLRRLGTPRGGLQVHGFTGSAEVAREWLKVGAHLSFGGTLTGAVSARRLAGLRAVPDHRLLVETDAPDQPVAAARIAGRPGSPADLPDVVSVVAQLRGQSVDQVARVTADNARTLFRLDKAGRSPT